MAFYTSLSLARLFQRCIGTILPTPRPLLRSQHRLGYIKDVPRQSFTLLTHHVLVGAWVITFATGVLISLLSLSMPKTKRHLHQVLILVQAIALLGYSTAISAYDYIPRHIPDSDHPSPHDNDVLIGTRDEHLVHYMLPILCLPFIVYVINHMAGIFRSEGFNIIATLSLSCIYGIVSLFLPRGWLGSLIAALSVVFGVPYLMALFHTWPSSVRAAPLRVRSVLKASCFAQILVFAVSLITFDLAMHQTISADLENAIMTSLAVTLYSGVPLMLLANARVLQDVYSREEYISQTKKASMNTPTALRPSLSGPSPSGSQAPELAGNGSRNLPSIVRL